VAWVPEEDHPAIPEAALAVEDGHDRGLTRGPGVGVGRGATQCGQADPVRHTLVQGRGQDRAQGLDQCPTRRTLGTVGAGAEAGL